MDAKLNSKLDNKCDSKLKARQDATISITILKSTQLDVKPEHKLDTKRDSKFKSRQDATNLKTSLTEGAQAWTPGLTTSFTTNLAASSRQGETQQSQQHTWIKEHALGRLF